MKYVIGECPVTGQQVPLVFADNVPIGGVDWLFHQLSPPLRFVSSGYLYRDVPGGGWRLKQVARKCLPGEKAAPVQPLAKDEEVINGFLLMGLDGRALQNLLQANEVVKHQQSKGG